MEKQQLKRCPIGIQTFCREERPFQRTCYRKQETEWTEYPVLHFDMSLAKHLDKEKLNEYLVWQLREYNGKYGLTKTMMRRLTSSWQT